MSDLVALESSARRQSWRVWAAFLSLLGVLAILPFVVLVVYDGPAPQDSHMVPQWPAPPSGSRPVEQPLAVFLSATSHLHPPGSPLPDTSSIPGLSPAQLADHAARQPSLEALDTLLTTDPGTWEWPDGSRQEKLLQMDRDSPDVFGTVKVLLMIRARHASASGNVDQSLQECFKLIRLGHGLTQLPAAPIRLELAARHQMQGIALLEHLLTEHPVSAEQLVVCLKLLLPLSGPSGETCRFAIRVQYQNLKDLLQDAPTQQALLEELARFPPWRNEIKVHQTLSRWLVDFSPVYDALAESWPSASGAVRATPNRHAPLPWWQSQRLTWQRNRAGRIYGTLTSPLFMVNTVIKLKTTHAQAITMLALRLQELKQGRLPDRLDQLASENLSAPMRDPHSGQLFQWRLNDRLLYSVGADAADDGGAADLHANLFRPKNATGTRQATDDLGQYYWWSQEARDQRIARRSGAAEASAP